MNRVRAFAFDHRRPLAAALAALAVLAGLQSLPSDRPGSPVVVAAHDLASGHILTADDLTVVALPRDAQPSHLLDEDAAIGRSTAGPVRAGEPITDRRVIEPRDVSGYGPDAVLTMVRIDDPAAVAGLRVGDRVDVVATASDDTTAAQVVAPGATIALMPARQDDRGDAAVIGVITDRAEALDLTATALRAQLSVLVTS